MADKANPQPGGTEAQHESTEPTTFFTRRRIIKGAGVATGIGVIGGGSLLYGTQPTLAAGTDGITAQDWSTTTNAGSVTEVTLSPSLTLDWSDFSSGVSGFDIVVKAAPSSGTVTAAKSITGVSDGTTTGVSSVSVADSGSLSDKSGTANVDLSGVDLVGGGALDASTDLPTDVADGATGNKTVDYAIKVTANSATGGDSATDTPTGSFDVTLSNTAGTTSASGTLAPTGTTGN